MASQCSRQCFADLSQITSIIKITENIWNCDGLPLIFLIFNWMLMRFKNTIVLWTAPELQNTIVYITIKKRKPGNPQQQKTRKDNILKYQDAMFCENMLFWLCTMSNSIDDQVMLRVKGFEEEQ